MKGFLIALSAAFLFFPIDSIQAQKNEKQNTGALYWFAVQIKRNINAETARPVLQIETVYNQVFSGKFKNFGKTYRNNLKKNKLLIGPFATKEEAKHAIEFYLLCQKDSIEARLKFDSDNPIVYEYFWYLVRPGLDMNDGSIRLERIPARVAKGSVKELFDVMDEVLTHELLLIGPFDYYALAEKSKYISRKYGESGFDGKESPPVKGDELFEMAKQWESVPFEAFASEIKDDSIHFQIALKFNFPSGYFSENAVQVLSFAYKNKDVWIDLNEEETFQGVSYQDNNPIVRDDQERRIKLERRFSKSEIQNGFIVIKSILLSDLQLMECVEKHIPIHSGAK